MKNKNKIYNDIYQSNYHKILNYLSRTVGVDDAKDLTQEVFIKVYNSIEKFDNNSSIYTWIYRIATNTLIDKMRKKKISVDKCNIIDKKLFDLTNVTYLTEEFKIVQDEMNVCICSYIKMLPTKYRSIIVLKEYEQMSIEQIAIIMDMSTDNVKKTLYRARRKLKSLLIDNCDFYYNENNQFSCEKK